MKKKRKAPGQGGARISLSKEAESCLHIAYNAIIESMQREKVAEAICFLNHGLHWIDELPGKPDGWDDMDPDIKAYFRDVLADAAELTIGSKAVDRYYRQIMLGYSDREFEDFWQSAQIKLLHSKLRQGRLDEGDGCRYSYGLCSLCVSSWIMSIAAIIISLVQIVS